MLRRAAVLGASALAALVVLLAAPAPAWAECWEEEQTVCPPGGGACRIEVVVVCDDEGDDSGGSGGGGGGGSSECTWEGQVVDCHRPGWGWYNPSDSCYYQLMEPQPDDSDLRWGPLDPAEYDMYAKRCLATDGEVAWDVRTDPPPGYGGGGGITPEQLAQQAVELLPITGPAIGIAPDPDGSGLVGLPVWIWTERTDETWGPISATASVPGLSVTATATADYIDWSMGNGDTVRCTEPGTPYEGTFGMATSPDCGYDEGYPEPGAFTVTGTTMWTISWTVDGGGASGSLTTTRSSSVDILIEEAQAVR